MNVAARLLADENVPGAVVAALRQQGHDVAWIHEDAPGSPDSEVLERAQRESRVVVTFDKDFSELAFRRGLAASVGVVLFRITLTAPDYVARAAVAASRVVPIGPGSLLWLRMTESVSERSPIRYLMAT